MDNMQMDNSITAQLEEITKHDLSNKQQTLVISQHFENPFCPTFQICLLHLIF